jgi:hypothetical protein
LLNGAPHFCIDVLHPPTRALLLRSKPSVVLITGPINKELGGSFTAAAYPLTETGSVIKTTNPNLNK